VRGKLCALRDAVLVLGERCTGIQAAGKAGEHEYLAVTVKRRRIASASRWTGVQTVGKAGEHEYLAVTAKSHRVPSALAADLVYSRVSHPVALDGQGIGERRSANGARTSKVLPLTKLVTMADPPWTGSCLAGLGKKR